MFAGMTFTIFDAVATVVNSINRLVFILLQLCRNIARRLYYTNYISYSFIISNNNNNNNQNLNLQTSSNTLLTSNINVANQINVMNMLGKRKRRKKREIATLARKGIEALKTFSDEFGHFLR